MQKLIIKVSVLTQIIFCFIGCSSNNEDILDRRFFRTETEIFPIRSLTTEKRYNHYVFVKNFNPDNSDSWIDLENYGQRYCKNVDNSNFACFVFFVNGKDLEVLNDGRIDDRYKKNVVAQYVKYVNNVMPNDFIKYPFE